jgi:hypothetical protein
MAKLIEIRFTEEDIAARAELLAEQMPHTCNELVKHLPVEAKATHARYSGSEVAMLLDNSIRIDRENATSFVQTGDVAYVWLNKEDHYGLDEDVSEICWFYDRDSIPRMFEGPVLVNVFARIVGDASEFHKACADTRITGQKTVRISLVE